SPRKWPKCAQSVALRFGGITNRVTPRHSKAEIMNYIATDDDLPALFFPEKVAPEKIFLADHAEEALRRGFTIFPLRPRDKRPLDGFRWRDEASAFAGRVGLWWIENPDANIGIECERSGVTVVDIDRGIETAEGFFAWQARTGWPRTYVVRTARGFHIYYRAVLKTERFE